MNEVCMHIVVPFVLIFREKILIVPLSRTKSNGCKVRAAEIWCRIASQEDTSPTFGIVSNPYLIIPSRDRRTEQAFQSCDQEPQHPLSRS